MAYVYLVHWGIKGMHWGDRNYQNKDGSYKPGAEGRYDPDPSGNGQGKKHLFKAKRTEPSEDVKKTETRETDDDIELQKKQNELLKLKMENAELEARTKALMDSVNGQQVNQVVTEEKKHTGLKIVAAAAAAGLAAYGIKRYVDSKTGAGDGADVVATVKDKLSKPMNKVADTVKDTAKATTKQFAENTAKSKAKKKTKESNNDSNTTSSSTDSSGIDIDQVIRDGVNASKSKGNSSKSNGTNYSDFRSSNTLVLGLPTTKNSSATEQIFRDHESDTVSSNDSRRNVGASWAATFITNLGKNLG